MLIFVSIILLFQIVNSGRILKKEEALIDDKENVINILKSQNEVLKDRIEDNNLFSLLGNNKSLDALGRGYEDSIVPLIKDALYETNISEKKNSIIPYEDMNGIFLINQVKVLNHRWIIANFSDGDLWGELLIEYNINKNNKISFTTIDHFLYPSEK